MTDSRRAAVTGYFVLALALCFFVAGWAMSDWIDMVVLWSLAVYNLFLAHGIFLDAVRR